MTKTMNQKKVMTTYSITPKGQALLSHHVRKSIDLPDYVLVLNSVANLPEATKEALVVMGFPDLDLHLQYLLTCGFLKEEKK